LKAVQTGDLVIVKGSNGSRMSKIVTALKDHYPTRTGVLASQGY
jgi:hypothetical protein